MKIQNAVAETDRIRAITPEIDTFYKKVGNVRLPIKLYKRKSRVFVLAIHGGGFKAVKEDSAEWSGGWMNFQAQYYADKGFGAAAISYRCIDISEDTTVFDQIDDCRDALDFIRRNAEFEKLVIIGDSAGAYLALQLGLDDSVGADIVIAANPVIDLEPWKYIVNTSEELEKASPMRGIKKSNTDFLCIHGNGDTVVDFRHTREFTEKLSAAGTKCDYIELEGIDHAFILSRYQSSDEKIFEYMDMADKFIEENM